MKRFNFITKKTLLFYSFIHILKISVIYLYITRITIMMKDIDLYFHDVKSYIKLYESGEVFIEQMSLDNQMIYFEFYDNGLICSAEYHDEKTNFMFIDYKLMKYSESGYIDSIVTDNLITFENLYKKWLKTII